MEKRVLEDLISVTTKSSDKNTILKVSLHGSICICILVRVYWCSFTLECAIHKAQYLYSIHESTHLEHNSFTIHSVHMYCTRVFCISIDSGTGEAAN